MSHEPARICRRDLLGLAVASFVAVTPLRLAGAETTADAAATAPIAQLDNALLASMKAGETTPFDDRYRALDVKLRMFQDNLVLLVDLARQRQTFVLEFAVAILIAMEMAVVMID